MGFVKTVKEFYIYVKPYRKQFALGLLALLGVDLLNTFPPLLLKDFIDQSSLALSGTQKSFMPFFWLGMVYFAIALAQGVCRYLWRMFLIRASYQSAEALREKYFLKLQRLPPSFYDRRPIGDLMSLATNDIEAVRFALGPGLLVFADAIFLFISLPPAMLWLSPKLTFISLLPLLIIPFLVIRTQTQMHDRFEAVQSQFSKLSAFVQENLEGIRVVKAFVKEWTQIDRFAQIGKEFIRLNLRLARSQSLLDPIFIFATALGLVSLLLFSGKDVITGHTSLGTFVAFTRYLDQLIWPLTALGVSITYYQRGKGSLGRLLEVLNYTSSEESRKPESSIVWLKHMKDQDPNTPLLEVRNLTFAYPDQKQPTLENISFSIQQGTRNALIGRIGSGKSTLVKLFTGLYPAPPGTIFFRGTDITRLPLSFLRNELSIVPQEAFLFSESLGWNVQIGAQSTEAEIKASLLNAGLERELTEWDLDHLVGERGTNLSGGQRARVTLARALVRKSSILILDDALASIDSETESKILANISSIFDPVKSQTLLMITHRLTALTSMDQILVLDGGRLVEKGPPTELLESPGVFRRLTELQWIEDELSTS